MPRIRTLDHTARFGLEFNPFLKNSNNVLFKTLEYKELQFRLNSLLSTKGFGILTGGAAGYAEYFTPVLSENQASET